MASSMNPGLMYVFEPQATNRVNAPSRSKFSKGSCVPPSSLYRILKGSTRRANQRTFKPCRFADLTGGEI